MANGLSWISVTLAALDAAIAGASAFDRAVATRTRARLVQAGTAADTASPAGPFNLATSEDAAHVAWRSAMAAALEELDELAAAVDGGPATTVNVSDPDASRGTIQARAKAAAETTHALAPAVEDARRVALPREPGFRPARYYQASPIFKEYIERPKPIGGGTERVKVFATYGELELALRAAIAEASALVPLI